MTAKAAGRRRPSVHITLARASRLHDLVQFLSEGPRPRDEILKRLGVGLRTFYREVDLLKRCGVRTKYQDKRYILAVTFDFAQGRLPFPDPQLSFAEMSELARCDCDAGRRLAQLLASVATHESPPAGRKRAGKKR